MASPVSSSTIHRLLQTRKGNGGSREQDENDADADSPANSLSYKKKFARNAQSPLDADVIVVDEVGWCRLTQ
jgi:hypothetical protein